MRQLPPTPHNDFDVIDDDDNRNRLPSSVSQTTLINDAHPIESNAERICSALEQGQDPSSIMMDINGKQYSLPSMLILDDPKQQSDVYRQLSAINKGISQGTAKHAFFSAAEFEGKLMGNHPYLIVFNPDRSKIITEGTTVKSIMGEKTKQRLILPFNKDTGLGIGANQIPSKPFLVIATPSLAVIDGKVGTLNWHVASNRHIDLSTNTTDHIARLKAATHTIKPAYTCPYDWRR